MKLVHWTAVVITGVLAFGQTVWAEDFRVESKVFAGNDKEPAAESLALFYDNCVYDFLSSPREITVLDIPRGRIVMLDPAGGVRAELTTARLTEFCEQLKARAAGTSDKLLQFAAQPQFEQGRDDEGWLRLASPKLTYRIRTVGADAPALIGQYSEFADWSARLNAMLRPGSLPPFARLAVNAALRQEQQLPGEVEVTIDRGAADLGTVVRSEHDFCVGLSGDDRRQIEEARAQLVTLKQVQLEEYLRPVEQARR